MTRYSTPAPPAAPAAVTQDVLRRYADLTDRIRALQAEKDAVRATLIAAAAAGAAVEPGPLWLDVQDHSHVALRWPEVEAALGPTRAAILRLSLPYTVRTYVTVRTTGPGAPAVGSPAVPGRTFGW